jgi:Ulp1 family protease
VEQVSFELASVRKALDCSNREIKTLKEKLQDKELEPSEFHNHILESTFSFQRQLEQPQVEAVISGKTQESHE